MAARKNRATRKNRANRKNNSVVVGGKRRRSGTRKAHRKGRKGTRRHRRH